MSHLNFYHKQTFWGYVTCTFIHLTINVSMQKKRAKEIRTSLSHKGAHKAIKREMLRLCFHFD